MSDGRSQEIYIAGVGYLTITKSPEVLAKIPDSEGAWVVCNHEHLFVPFYRDMASIINPEIATANNLAFVCLSRTITEEEILLLKKRLSQKKGQRVVANN